MQKRKLRLVGWEITNKCNLSCPHCYSSVVRHSYDELNKEECISVIAALAKQGPEIIGWTGGEPLLYEDLEELIVYAWNEYGIKSGITTNGILLDRRRAERLKDAGVHSIQISLDGSTPERNRRIRLTTEEEFYKILEGIRICKQLEIKCNLATLLGAENLDDAPEMLKLARREGIPAIRFCGFTPAGRAQNTAIQKRFSFCNGLSELHDFIESAQKDDAVTAMFDPGFGPVPPHYCFHECIAGIETVYIKANGDVYPCTSLLYDEFIVGNLRESSFDDIWNDPAMMSMAAFPRDEIEGACSLCDNFRNCHGACRSLTFANTGSFYESFPVCLYQAGKKNSSVSADTSR